MTDNDWIYRTFCACGWSHEPANGDVYLTRLDHPFCPNCGTSGAGYEMFLARPVSGATGTKFEIAASKSAPLPAHTRLPA